MDEVGKILAAAERMLASLNELSGLSKPSAIERDAAIKRFDMTFNLACQAASKFLPADDSIDVRTPKSIARAARGAGLLDERQTEAVLQMADDRILTPCCYKEDLAVEIFGRLDGHARLMESWLAAMGRGPEEG